jgi:hypothetical protein
MAYVKKPASKMRRGTNKTYLTKRRLSSAASAGIRLAAASTIQVMGYTIVAENGWVVKKYPDGRVLKIKKLAKQKKNLRFILD